MSCHPISRESLEGLRSLRELCARQGDRCVALLLAGVELYVSAGRELELLEIMRNSAEEMREAIENTPSAQDLRRLYERD